MLQGFHLKSHNLFWRRFGDEFVLKTKELSQPVSQLKKNFKVSVGKNPFGVFWKRVMVSNFWATAVMLNFRGMGVVDSPPPTHTCAPDTNTCSSNIIA